VPLVAAPYRASDLAQAPGAAIRPVRELVAFEFYMANEGHFIPTTIKYSLVGASTRGW
jgi:hypothetical protein